MTVAIYIRVSTDEQVREGFSIDAQKDMLKAYCKSQGWNNYKFYIDEGLSAKDTDRPSLQNMIKHIKKGLLKKVLVYRLDRITRSVIDLHKLLETFEENDCAFISSTEPYDTSTALGRLFITLVAAMAQWERENTGERISMVLDQKAKSGEWLAQAPFGFKKTEKKTENGKAISTLEPCEKTSPILKDIINRVKSGQTTRQVADYLTDSGIPPVRGYRWHSTSIIGMLKNPAIYGAMRWKDDIMEGTHKGIITKNEYEHLLKILSERSHVKYKNIDSTFIFQMKIECYQCKGRLASERHTYQRKDGTYRYHHRYRCQSCARDKRPPVSVSEKDIDNTFVEFMKKITFDEIPEEEKKDDPKSVLLQNIKRVEGQRAKYQRAWANDLMTDEEFNDRMNETQSVLNEWREELKGIQSNYEHYDQEEIKGIVNNFNLNWKNITPEEKKEFLNRFIEKIEFKRIQRGSNGIKILDVVFY